MARHSGTWIVLTAALAVVGCAGGGSATGTDSDAACAGPLTLVEVATVGAGDSLRVTAENLVDACYDQGEGLLAEPLLNQPVTWRQGTDSVELAVVDAEGTSGTVEVTVTVPADAQPGAATVEVGRAEPADVTVTP